MKGDTVLLQEAREVSEDLLEKPLRVGELTTVVDPSPTPRGLPRSWVNAESDHTDSGCRTRITSIHIPAHRIHRGAAGGLHRPAQVALPQYSTGNPLILLYMDHLATEDQYSMETTLDTHLHLDTHLFMALHQNDGFLRLIIPSGVHSDGQALRSTTGAGAPHPERGLLAGLHLVGITGMAQEVMLIPPVGIQGSLAHPTENPESFMEGVHIQRGTRMKLCKLGNLIIQLCVSLQSQVHTAGW